MNVGRRDRLPRDQSCLTLDYLESSFGLPGIVTMESSNLMHLKAALFSQTPHMFVHTFNV